MPPSASILAEHDQRALAEEILELTPRDVAAVRSVLARVSSSHITESVADLIALGITGRD